MKALALITTLAIVQAQAPANVTGTWEWHGSAGWQRIEMTLKADGTKLTGLLRMGPGANEPASSSEFWQYFFDPVDFKISNGRVEGNQIGFEQLVLRPVGLPQQGRGSLQTPPRTYENRFINVAMSRAIRS